MTALLVKLFIRDSENIKDNRVRAAYGTLGSVTGITANLLLCILKLAAGLLSGSISLAADGLNNLSDMGSSVITMLGFKLANKPADSDHPFGHGRMEYMSAFAVSVLILLVGTELLKTSVKALVNGADAPNYTAASVIILILSIAIKLFMFCFNRSLGKKIDSEALLATAGDSLNDCFATGAILISVAVSQLVRLPFSLDAVMGIGVAIFILYSGISSAKSTIDRILGAPPEKSLIEEIESIILSFEEFVGIHDLIVHNYGPGRQFASVHVEVPQSIDIVRCHEQIDLCEKLINERLNIILVIHMDPIDTENESIAATKALLSEKLSGINPALTLHDFRMTPLGDKRTNLIFDVVVPPSLKLSENELHKRICSAAKEINPTFTCVITFDSDFTGAVK